MPHSGRGQSVADTCKVTVRATTNKKDVILNPRRAPSEVGRGRYEDRAQDDCQAEVWKPYLRREPSQAHKGQWFVFQLPFGALIEEVRFATDSPAEEDGFEPSVPL